MLFVSFALFFMGLSLFSFLVEPSYTTRVLILMGAPGSGKGTQAVRLSRELGLPHLSTGDLFREHMQKESPLGLKAKKFIERGELVPDELVLEMLFDRASQADCQAGYILDGFPRTLAQAEALDRSLDASIQRSVLSLEVRPEEIVERISGRRVCSRCGQTFHIAYCPPKRTGVCDSCGGELDQRRDDSPEVVQKRLEVYRKETRPVEDYYNKKGVLIKIDGEQPPDLVFEELKLAARRAL